jgi:hypothetical protein
LSAVHAAALKGMAGLPAYVVAGSLIADGVRISGDGKSFDGKIVFLKPAFLGRGTFGS